MWRIINFVSFLKHDYHACVRIKWNATALDTCRLKQNLLSSKLVEKICIDVHFMYFKLTFHISDVIVLFDKRSGLVGY